MYDSMYKGPSKTGILIGKGGGGQPKQIQLLNTVNVREPDVWFGKPDGFMSGFRIVQLITICPDFRHKV